MNNYKSQFFIYKIFRKIINFLYKFSLNSIISYFLFLCSIISCSVTYLSFSEYITNNISSKELLYLLYIDIILLLILIALVGNKIVKLWSVRKKSSSLLQRRMVILFSLLAIIPSVFMSGFAAFFFHNGIESWLNNTNKTILQESLNVAEAYLTEHQATILKDGIVCSSVIEFTFLNQFMIYPLHELHKLESFNKTMEDLLGVRSINCAIIYDSDMNVIFHSKLSSPLLLERISPQDFQDTIVDAKLIKKNQKHILTALIPFTVNEHRLFLLIQKPVDEKVLNHVDKTQRSFTNFKMLSDERLFLEVTFVMIFMFIVILLLFAAIGIAISFSTNLTRPISSLIDAAEQIQRGDLTIKIQHNENDYDEVHNLINVFNEMVLKVFSQQKELENKNIELLTRQQFTQTILSGTSSGIIGLDNNLKINMWNKAVLTLLHIKLNTNTSISNIFPEIVVHLNEFADQIKFDKLKTIQRNHTFNLEGADQDISVHCETETSASNKTVCDDYSENQFKEVEIQYRVEKQLRVFIIKIMKITNGYVLTIDDVTNLLLAQRKSMWEDIARRVAHEIKNPLTPIQLSAERLKRKYSTEVTSKEKFIELIDVIVRQVGDIKRLTDEFTMFARLPTPVFKNVNIIDVCKQACVLMQQTDDNIHIFIDNDLNKNIPNPFIINIAIDERLIHQALINIIKNAIIAHQSSKVYTFENEYNYSADLQNKDEVDVNTLNVEAYANDKCDFGNVEMGHIGNSDAQRDCCYVEKMKSKNFIKMFFEIKFNKLHIFIQDNGPGLPTVDATKLIEPYVSMSQGGSGLGLAIVKKIIDDHNGTIEIANNVDINGAICHIELPFDNLIFS